MKQGDTFTIEGFYERRTFWQWLRREPKQPQEFIVCKMAELARTRGMFHLAAECDCPQCHDVPIVEGKTFTIQNIHEAVTIARSWAKNPYPIDKRLLAAIKVVADNAGEKRYAFNYVNHALELIGDYTGEDENVINAHGLLCNAKAELER